jgi:hypothetical protein
MFRRAWWTRRRIALGVAIVALLVVAVVCECGTEEVREGQPLDEAKAALHRAGAKELQNESFGFFFSVPRREMLESPPDRVASCWEFPDGRTFWLAGFREKPDQPYHVESFGMWRGWLVRGSSETNRFPETKCVRLTRSPW